MSYSTVWGSLSVNEEARTVDLNNPEILLVSGALLRPALVAEAARYVEMADFEDLRLGKLWDCIVGMVNEGLKEDQIDEIGVARRFVKDPAVQTKVMAYLATLTAGMPKMTSLVVLAQRVRRRATMRLALTNMREIATDLKDQIASNDGEMPDLDVKLSGLSVAVTTRSDVNTRRAQFKDSAKEVMAYFDGLYSNDKKMYIPTGIPKLDRKLGGGLRPGQLHVLLASTGGGKTALASQLCDEAVKHGRRAMLFSMEVDPMDVFIRDVERRAGVSRWELRKDHAKDAAHAALTEAAMTLMAAGGKIVHGQPISIEGIRQAVLTERVRSGKIDMIAVDHAQVAEPSKSDLKTMPRYLMVKGVAEGLRMLARQLNVAVLLTAQMNAPGKDEKPTMENVREGKDINNTAEVVITLWHDKGEGIDGEPVINASWLTVEKCRAGTCGRIEIVYKGETFSFGEKSNG